MKKETIRKISVGVIVAVFLLAIASLGLVTHIYKNKLPVVEKQGNVDSFGKYTFERSAEIEGKKVSFKESGDEKFRYYHDSDGNMLLRDENSITYATLSSGKVVSSGVSIIENGEGVEKITPNDIDFSINKELLSTQDRAVTNGGMVTTTNENGEEVTEYVPQKPLLAAGVGNKRIIVNFVILIKFNDTSQAVVDNAITSFDRYFNATSDSLRNYYEVLSYNDVTINSILPRENGNVVVYNGGNRSTYNIPDANSAARREKEAELLTGAVSATHDKFDLAGKNPDINGDGYVDSVSFLICGSNESTWGGLLWPHSWNLDSIDGNSFSSIAGAKVGDYSFNFSTTINTGVLCHEMGHVLGAPDLYHYNYDYVPVGKWDLMSSNTDNPQYMLSYMRQKYIGGIAPNKIIEINTSGVYELKPVTMVSKSGEDVLAYKIKNLGKSTNEYFVVEYRNPNIVTGYDATAPNAGLIAYRIREPNVSPGQASPGNKDARFQSSIYPDEVHIFRPKVDMTSNNNIYANSAKDVNRANLSPQNPYFNRVGNSSDNSRYNYNNLFYSDGTNSSIEIETISMSSDGIQFRVKTPNSSEIPADYFNGKIRAQEVKFFNSTEWGGVKANIIFNANIDVRMLASVVLELKDVNETVIATNTLNLGKFKAEYNKNVENTFEVPFIANNKGKNIDSIFYTGTFQSESEPTKMSIKIIDANGQSIQVTTNYNVDSAGGSTWADIIAKGQLKGSVYAGPRISVGLDKDGKVHVSGSQTTGMWEASEKEDVVGVAVGKKHIILVKKDMKVEAYGDNFYGETIVDTWQNVKQVAAGDYTSYALFADGTVSAMGVNDVYQLQVGSWRNIVNIVAGKKHVLGLDATGKVYAAGDLTNQVGINGKTGVKKIAAGESFSAVLTTEGEIEIFGTLAGGITAGLEGVTDIKAGYRHLLVLLSNGTVRAFGENSARQCEVGGLYDIADMAASESHSVFLREDGIVEYRGNGNAQYGTNTPLGNLKFDTYKGITSVSLTSTVPASNNRLLVGATAQIGVTVLPTDATYQRVIFISSNPAILSVNMLGEGSTHRTAEITAHATGTVEITAIVNGSNAVSSTTFTVYEEKPLQGVNIIPSSVRMITGKTVKLNYEYNPIDATNVEGITPTFTSSNASIVSVDGVSGQLTAEAVGSSTITVSTTVSETTYTATCNVTVVNEGVSIAVTQTSNPIKVKQNGKIDLSYVHMDVTIGTSSPTRVQVTEDMLSYNTGALGAQDVTVNYQGATATVIISVEKYVVSAEFSTLPRSNYIYGEPLTSDVNEIGKIKANFSDSTSTTYTVQSTSVTGYNANLLGQQTLKYRFQDPAFTTNIFELRHVVIVSDIVDSIVYTPRQVNYPFGASISTIEEIELTMKSGTTRYEDFDSPNIIIEGYSPLVRGQQSVTVSYKDVGNNNNVLHADSVIIAVLLLGEFVYRDKDKENATHYYEKGKNFVLDIEYEQTFGDMQGERIPVKTKEETPNIWYELTGFDNSKVGEEQAQFVVYNVYTQYSTIGTDGTAEINPQYLLGRFNIKLVGLLVSDSWEIVMRVVEDSQVIFRLLNEEGYNGQPVVYEYANTPAAPSPKDLIIRRHLPGGGTDLINPAMEVVYDPELLNEDQVVGVRYLNEWKYTKVTIEDAPQELVNIPSKVISYGENLNISVYVMLKKKGQTLLRPEDYKMIFKHSGDGNEYPAEEVNTRVGIYSVTVNYVKPGAILPSLTFSLEVRDVFASIDIEQDPKITYRYGDSFDPTGARFKVTMASGKTYVENYGATSQGIYTYSPELNGENTIVAQTITITFRNSAGTYSKSWRITCTVQNFAKTLTVNLNKTAYEYGEALSIGEVRIAYADGTSSRLRPEKYSHSYNSQILGSQEVLFVFEHEDTASSASVIVQVTVYDVEQSVRVINRMNRTDYGYGEALDLFGLKVEVKYKSGKTVEIEGDEVRNALDIVYNPKLVGLQEVDLKGRAINSQKASVSVTVLKFAEKDTLAFEANDVMKLDLKVNVVAIKVENRLIGEVFNSFTYANYFTAQMLDKNGTVLNVNSERILRTGDKVVFKNQDGTIIFDFEIHVFGDANGDGKSTQSDLDQMSKFLLDNKNYKYIMDINGDGKATLADLVLFARKFSL